MKLVSAGLVMGLISCFCFASSPKARARGMLDHVVS
jgi:hypothetical protein